MAIVAIIPARGNSKGIPRKNLVDICGKPLIAWSIEQALACPLIDEVWVSSDSDEILEVARHYGAEAWKRPAELATDTASSDDVIAEWMKWRYRHKSEAIVFLQATSPIRQPNDITNAVMLLRDAGDRRVMESATKLADAVFSARIVEGYTWVDGGPAPFYPKPFYSKREPRQERHVKTLEENGSIYVLRPHVLQDSGSRLGKYNSMYHIEPYIMHPLDSFQIDEPQDIPLEAIQKASHEKTSWISAASR